MTRRIRALVLDGGTPAERDHAVRIVGDALRTASIPGLSAARGRLLVVRAVDLGVVSARRAPQALALRITDQIRRMGSAAVHGVRPEAAGANAVWFVDRAEARAAYLDLRVSGPPPVAWYWAASVGDPQPDAPVPALVARWLAPSPPIRSTEPPVLAAAVRQLEALVERGPARAIAVLSRAPPRAILPGLPIPRGAPIDAPPTAPEPAPVPAAWALVVRWAAALADPEREVRLTVAARIASDLARALHPAPIAAVAAQVAASRRRPRAGPTPAADPRPPPPVDPVEAVDPPSVAPTAATPTPARPVPLARPPAQPQGLPSPAAPRRRRLALSTPPPPAPAGRPQGPAQPPTEPPPLPRRGLLGPPPPLDAPALTPFGGLLFLVNPLDRLGLGRAIADDPALADQALGWRALDALGRRVGAPTDDPSLRAVAPRAEPDPPDDRPFVGPPGWWHTWDPAAEPITVAAAPGDLRLARIGADGWLARWRGAAPDARLADLEAPSGSIDLAEARAALAEGWAAAVERWCARVAGIAAADVVRRPAIVGATPTHVDVVLPAAAIDLAVRRWALDADPAWVPWLGRVIALHYVEQDAFAALMASLSG